MVTVKSKKKKRKENEITGSKTLGMMTTCLEITEDCLKKAGESVTKKQNKKK